LLKDTTQLKPRNIKCVDVLKDSVAIERFGDRGVNGAVLVTSIKGISKKDSIQFLPNAAGIYNYGTTELFPVFPGGEKALLKFVESNLHYPKASAERHIEGRTVLRFVIGKTGAVEEVSVVRSLSLDCDMEAARVIKMMPTWLPAMMKGQPVPVYYTIPMVYKLVR
jgi:TonB family protein